MNRFSDVAGYKIYYELTNSGDLELLKTLNDKNTFSYKHYPGQYISGCYAISAFDAAGNESAKSALVCVDSCNFYEIPMFSLLMVITLTTCLMPRHQG